MVVVFPASIWAMIPMFRKSRTSSVALLFAPWKDEYFLGVMNDLRDLFMNSLLSLSNVISDFALAMRWKTTGTYLLHTNCKTVLGNAFIPSIEMGCICIKKNKTIMNYKIYKEVILFHSILILFYRKLVLKDKTCLFESLGIMILIKNCTVLSVYKYLHVWFIKFNI